MNSERNHIAVTFVGDISFNDDYIKYYKAGVNPFKSIQPSLQSKDFVIGNLECMAKGENGENLLRRPRISTTAETLNYLSGLNVKLVSLAHNHVFDHLEDGFKNTTESLDKNGIRYLGASQDRFQFDKPVILNERGVSIGLLNYVTLDTNPNMPDNAGVYLNVFEVEKARKDIIDLKQKTDHVVALLHWGGRVEGGYYPDYDQPEVARALIDAGADLIIGSHSHTIQPFEIYKGKYIFYSLGNFCFSDYVFENTFNPLPPRQYITTLVSVIFEKESYQVDLEFFENRKTEFVKINYDSVLKRRNWLFKVFFRKLVFWKMYFFHKKKILPLMNFMNRGDINFTEKMARLLNSFKKRIKPQTI
ncbi:MAG: CapA family protein [Bacteroidetes bacterium]|nr:CapA family protein [Bacteroidota bacterium]